MPTGLDDYLKGCYVNGGQLALIVWQHEWIWKEKAGVTRCAEYVTFEELGQILGGN